MHLRSVHPERRPLRERMGQVGFVSKARLPFRIVDAHRPAEVRLAGSSDARRLVWTWGATGAEPAGITETSHAGAIWRFVRLGGASDEAILAFAQRWGVLDLCEAHAFPAGHNPDESGADYQLAPVLAERAPGLEMPLRLPCRPEIWEPGWYAEPVDWWRMWARRLRSASLLLVALNKGETGAREDWAEVVMELHDLSAGRDWSRRPKHWQRSALADVVSSWLEQARLVPGVSWAGDYRLELTASSGLLTVLLAQLVAVMSSDADRPARCSRCPNPYPAQRSPRRGFRNFCQECRPEVDKAHKRESARKRRERERGSAIRTSEGGTG